MSAQVSRRSRPLDSQGSSYFPGNQGGWASRSPDQQRAHVVPLSFPATKEVLWDRTAIGDPTVLHITKYRNVSLCILEKSVQLAHRHALQSGHLPYACFLIGSIISDKDEEGVTITLDRFDPGRDIPGRSGRMPTARLPGDHVIPLLISSQGESPTTHSAEDFIAAFKLVEHNFSSHEPLDVAGAFSFRIHCCCYDSTDHVTFILHIGAVTMGNAFEATPINPVPVIPTALARNLMGPLSLSEIQGAPKVGYITMDQTRKLLLLLESDPKACTLPLVGIWLSGLSNMCSPFVWASCLKYMLNNSIHERVCTADQGFLLALFSPTSRQPTFYECRSLKGDDPTFELVGCRENIHFYKQTDQPGRKPVQLELTPARDGPNRAAFLEACKHFVPTSHSTKSRPGGKPGSKPAPLSFPRPAPATTSEEDASMMPRPSPKPLIDKSPSAKPSVPELSLIFDSFVEEEQCQDNSPQSQVPKPHPSSPGMLPQQPLPADRVHSKHPLPSSTQPAQENKPPGWGQDGQVRSIVQLAKMGHVDTPPGRPGPLKPVNANLGRGAVKVQQPSPGNPNRTRNEASHQLMKKATVSGPDARTRQSQHGTRSKSTSSTRNANGHHQQVVHENPQARVSSASQVSQNECTPRVKPPRPTSRRSEITPGTSPLMSDKQLRGKGYAPSRRMSYPAPASSQNKETPFASQKLHPSAHQAPATLAAPRAAHHHLQTHQSQGMIPGHLAENAGHADLPHAADPPRSASSTHRRSTGSLGSYPTASQSQTFSSIPHSHTSTAQHGFHHPSAGSPLAGSPQPLQGSFDAPENTRQCVDPSLSITSETDHTNENRTQSAPVHSAGHVPATQSDSPAGMHSRQGSPPSPLLPAQQMAVPFQPLPPPESTPGSQPQSVVQQEPPRGQGIESNDAMVQLRRQEQLIQQLQAQIQMLLQAQTAHSNPSMPIGLMTPPTTPKSPVTTEQQSTPPTFHLLSHNRSTEATPAVAHSVATDTGFDTTPPPRTTCSTAVMTGASLFWPDETGSADPDTKSCTSIGTSMTPQLSPSKGSPHPLTSARGQEADPDTRLSPSSDTDMTLPVPETRYDTQSTMFDVSAVDLQSFTEEGSPGKSSPLERSPEWKSDRRMNTPRNTHPETTQGTYPMDSLHSPVLGESASTCAPPRRRSYPTDDEEEEEDVDRSLDGSRIDDAREEWVTEETRGAGPPVSLLYRDERKFYQNLLGKVEQMLSDQTMDGGNHGDAMVTHGVEEELRHLGLTSGGQNDTLIDRSVMYRSMCMVNSDFFPRINYVSLMDVHLDSPNLSYEANAIAMKYLTEEELTQLSVGFRGQATPQPKVNPLLRSALMGLGDIGAASGSAQSAVDLSMASRKYMEKYGLLETPVKNPRQPQALKFGTAEETPGQRIVADKSKRIVRPESSRRKQLLKTTQVKTRSSQPAEEVATTGSETRNSPPVTPDPQRIQSSSQHEMDGEGTVPKPAKRRSAERLPPRKPPRQSPGTHPPSASPGHQDTNMGARRGQNHPVKNKKLDMDEKSRSNILDIERLKQLPKLF